METMNRHDADREQTMSKQTSAGASRKVLLLAGSDPAIAAVEQILESHTDLTVVSDLADMLWELAHEQTEVLFCDWRFPLGTWRDVLECVLMQYPELPVIVISRCGDEQQWREVLDAGGFDLVTGHSESAVLSVLEHAAASRDARLMRTVA